MVPEDDKKQVNAAFCNNLGNALTSIHVGTETLREPLRLKPFEHWVGHVPFAFWITAVLRPRVFVELGTHRGNSFLAFCQAIETEACGTRSYGVDTWEGDVHMRREEGLFEDLSAYHDPRYGHFSSLVRATFNEARDFFSDGSIDLLHIDGTHTYEAVKEDFELWRPALSERAVVLFHDTNVKRPQYGVWKLWEELSAGHPHFEFFHSYGLGVLGIGKNFPAALKALFDASSDEGAAGLIRAYFAARGAVGIQRLAKEMKETQAEEASRQHWADLERNNAQHATELEASRADFERQMSQQHSNLAAVHQQMQQEQVKFEGDRQEHERSLQAANEKLEQLNQYAQAIEGERDRCKKALETIQEEIENLRTHFEGVRRHETQRFLERSNGVNAHLARTEADLRRALVDLDAARSHVSHLQLQVQANVTVAQGIIEQLEKELSMARGETSALRSSTFWRLTAPLRALAEHVPQVARPGYRKRLRLLTTDINAEQPGVSGQKEPLFSAADITVPVAAAANVAVPHRPRETLRWPIRMPDLFELRDLKPCSRIAAVVHIYYPELCDELLDALSCIPEKYDLFITLVEDHSGYLHETLKLRFPEARIFIFPNRGRDILSFVTLASAGALTKYEFICKLHTKRSPHREDGDVWRQHLVSQILPSKTMTANLIRALDSDPDLGLIVADGQVFAGEEFWGGNLVHLQNLLPLLGYSISQATNLAFAGGSMFWYRGSLLYDLVGLNVVPEAYEPEPIGVDGSLAHAIERLFSIVCHAAGMKIAQASELKNVNPDRSEDAEINPPRMVAFYLPQFHPIPENDSWWGRGFTEWTNVTKAKPLFDGHRQPRLPGELGFTDLRLPETRAAQADLARAYGISAFCYYYYWFGKGRRLLHRPLDEVLASGQPDFPFMICWANEPWSRNWDGASKEVLLAQDYPEGWIEAFASDVAPIMRDPRYVRLGGRNGRPMLMIYRIMHWPEPREAIRKLRLEFEKLGLPDVHISAGYLAFEGDAALPEQPQDLGLDSFFEFPPHRAQAVPAPQQDVPEEMTGGLYEYAGTVDAALTRLLTEEDLHHRHRAVMMGWDNTARRASAAHVFRGATPGHFRRWLRGVVKHQEAQPPSHEEKLIFINAWNEWAEGTCLEPDRDFGRGWLEAVRSAIRSRT